MNETTFFLLSRSQQSERLARIVIESLRAFGGPFRESPVWIFSLDPDRVTEILPGIERIQRFPLVLEDGSKPYPFAEKVYACATAEAMAGTQVRSLVMLSLDCLILNPPNQFNLTSHGALPSADVALRPVHHRNIGSLAEEPLDSYWEHIYLTLEIKQTPFTIESFADQQILRPYFNSHCFAFNPNLGLAQTWWENFQTLVADQNFQSTACRNDLHKIFLHQAVLSTLIAKIIPTENIRLLPTEYNFPLNLINEMGEELKPAALNDLVNAVYEDSFPWGKIKVQEPLRSWLKERL